jgi:hypothetical protein
MLLLHRRPTDDSEPIQLVDGAGVHQLSHGHDKTSPYTRVSHFLPTTKKIMQFSDGKEPKPSDRILYIAGVVQCYFFIICTSCLNYLCYHEQVAGISATSATCAPSARPRRAANSLSWVSTRTARLRKSMASRQL